MTKLGFYILIIYGLLHIVAGIAKDRGYEGALNAIMGIILILIAYEVI